MQLVFTKKQKRMPGFTFLWLKKIEETNSYSSHFFHPNPLAVARAVAFQSQENNLLLNARYIVGGRTTKMTFSILILRKYYV